MRTLCVVQTPLQLLGVVALLASDEYAGETNDVILCRTFRDVEEYGERLGRLGCVNQVFLVAPYGESNEIFKSILRGGERDARHIPEHLVASGLSEAVRREGLYDRLVFGSAAVVVHDARRLFLKPDGTSILIDDGTGSHCGSIYCGLSFGDDILNHKAVVSSKSVRMRLALKPLVNVLTRGRFVFHVEKVCLFEPTARDRERFGQGVSVEALGLDAHARTAIDAVFPTDKERLYSKADAVFFTLPDGSDSAALAVEERALEKALGIFGHLVVRVHPRRTKLPSICERCETDGSSSCWEALLAAGLLGNGTALLGFSSTAQVSAAQFFGLRPPMVLLNRLLPPSKFVSEALEKTACELAALYEEKGFVWIPSCEGDLDRALSECCQAACLARGHGGDCHGR